jgi:ribonuclease VapC
VTESATPTHYVLDASALLCVLFGEPGAERVETVLSGAQVSAVNFSEVVAKLVDRGAPDDIIVGDLRELDIDIIQMDHAQAERAGLMRRKTRAAGLSVGDRACLALAGMRGAVAVTADRAWAGLDVGVTVEVVR